jgi:uncharacterized protein YndB with AHSA1/START domain
MADRTRGYAHRVDIAAKAERVWRALTDSKHLARWCAPDANIRPSAGGSFRATVDRVTELEAHIDVFVPERRLRLIFLPTAGLPPAETAIVTDFILEARPTGTIVRVLGSGIPGNDEWDTQYQRLRTGWERAMARLKVFIEKELDCAPSMPPQHRDDDRQ